MLSNTIVFVTLILRAIRLSSAATLSSREFSAPTPESYRFKHTVVDGNLPFDPTHCGIARPNPWQNLPILPQPPPRPGHGDGGIARLQNNISITASAGTNLGHGEPPAIKKSRRQVGPGGHCEQIGSFKFKNVIGYLRSTQQSLTENDSYYWVVWNSTHPTKGTVWRAQDPKGESWTKVYTSPMDGETKGSVQLDGGMDQPSLMLFDLSCSEGTGQGVSGEIALFRMGNRPPSRRLLF